MKRLIWVLTILMTAACANITINVYFPAEKIEQAADVIEDQVRSDVLEQESAEPSESTQSKAETGWWDRICPPAYAAEVDFNIDTPEIRAITERRKGRFAKIDALLTKGAIGEGKDGYLKEKDIRSLPLKEIAEARKLVREENKDRKGLYEAIADANDIDADKIPDIGVEFAQEIREMLRVGQFYQDDEGNWVAKKEKQ